MKSTPEEIRARFDRDVERFSNLETGQSATMDAPLALELIAGAVAATTPRAARLIDIGCGAGNYSLKLHAAVPSIEEITLIDLSRPMLDRAVERLTVAGVRSLHPVQGDIRDVPLEESWADAAVAAAVFHHLRADAEWLAVFAKVRRALRKGGWLWISDLVSHAHPGIQAGMWSRYGGYLAGLKGPKYRDHVFAYIEKEDSPRPLQWQCDALREAGFEEIEILHKNNCFAAWGARR